MADTKVLQTDLERQDDYVEQLDRSGKGGYALVAAETFVEGMRDSGYRSTATAIDELIDNAKEAGANKVFVLYEKDGRYVKNIAVIDNGHGMRPKMIRAAVRWGGTHRWNSREGFGRYGFGLPSAAVSITPHYEVYSRAEDEAWHRVVVDLNDIGKGLLTTDEGLVISPKPEEGKLPGFVSEYLDGEEDFEAGTVVLLSNPDRLSSGFVSGHAFHRNMMRHLGKIYRGMLRNLELRVGAPDGMQKVEPVDPLFLMPSARGYDVGNGVMAEEWDPLTFEVESEATGEIGTVTVRFSYMPPDFQNDEDGKNIPGRFKVMKKNNAFFHVCRAGRQIDSVTRTKFPKDSDNRTLVNYDRNWAIEVDFDPALDEEFGITVNKQQVTLSDRMWQLLANEGLPGAIKSLKKRHTEDRQKEAAKKDEEEDKASEQVMAESDKFRTREPDVPDEKKEEAKQRAQKDAQKKAEETGQEEEEVFQEIIEETQEKPYEVHFESLRGAPFYRVEQYGAQLRLYINTSHRFYGDIYARLDVGKARQQRIKVGLELMFFALGSCEHESSGDREQFYKTERNEWSKRLDNALTLLERRDSVRDAEEAEMAAAEA